MFKDLNELNDYLVKNEYNKVIPNKLNTTPTLLVKKVNNFLIKHKHVITIDTIDKIINCIYDII